MDISERISSLGKGRFGEVSCIRSNGDGTVVAVKVFSAEVPQSHIEKELQVLQVVSSKSNYIVALVNQETTEYHICIVMEAYTGGVLNKHIQQSGQCGFSVEIVRGYAAQLLSALSALEPLHCVHRDIKTSNCVLDHTGRLKLCDFGSAKILLATVENDSAGMRTHTITGTAHIMAPEMVAATDNGYDHSVDHWAYGAVLYELLTGSMPLWRRTCGGAVSRPSSRAAGRIRDAVDRTEGSTQVQWPDGMSSSIARVAIELSTEGVSHQQEGKSDAGTGAHSEEQVLRARGEWFIEAIDAEFVAKRGASANRSDGGFGMTERERREYGKAVDLVRDLLTVDPLHRLQNLERRVYSASGGGVHGSRWSSAVRGHPFFAAVDWQAVDEGTSPPADPSFDRRLGCIELLAEHDGEADTLTAAQQALFEGF